MRERVTVRWSAFLVVTLALVLMVGSASVVFAPASASASASTAAPVPPAPQAAARAKVVASCAQAKVVALQWSSGSTWQIANLDVGTGASTILATVTNPGGSFDGTSNRMDALAVTAGGLTAYLTDSTASLSGQSPRIHKVNLSTGSSTTFTGSPLVDTTSTNYPGITAGAIDPTSGIYYYAHAVTGSQYWRLYAWNTSTDTPIGQVGSLNVEALRFGDLSFDASGNLTMTTSSTSATRFYSIAAANVPRTASSASLTHTVTATSDATRVYGSAWSGPVGSYAAPSIFLARLSSAATSLLRYDPAAGTTPTSAPASVQSSTTDLASCAAGDVITLGKQISSRMKASDQFTWAITRGAATASATSTGSALGTQPQQALLAATPGTYTLTETGAAGALMADYGQSLTCVQRSTGATVPVAGSGTSRTLTYTSGTVDCQWVNTAVPTLTLSTAFPQGRYLASDQFTVQIRTGSPTGAVVSATANATTAGTGSTVTAGTGTTGAFRVNPTTTYHLTQAQANGPTLMANYVATITCTDPSGLQTGLPTNVAFNNNFSLQVVNGAQVACIINNAKRSTPGSGLTCNTGQIYATTNAVTNVGYGEPQNRRFIRVQVRNPPPGTSLGDVTAAAASQLPVPGGVDYVAVNAAAVSPGGQYLWYVANKQTRENDQPAVMRFDPLAPSTPWTPRYFTNSTGQALVIRGGINPTNGIFYMSNSLGAAAPDDTVHDFWAFNTLSNTMIGYVGRWSGGPAGAGGDLVFDQSGNMMFLASGSSGSVGSLVRVENMPVAAVPLTTSINSQITAKTLVADHSGLASVGGVAFDNDGYLYVSYNDVTSPNADTYIRRVDPNTGAVEATMPVSGMTASPIAIGDLADCNDPGAIRLKKNLVGRVGAGDQFNLVISPPTGATDLGNRATTSGSATGLQAAVAGPIVGVPGRVYTLTESAASGSLANYDISLACTDLTHNVTVPVTSVSAGVYTVTFPTVGADGILANVECVLTNTPTTRLTIRAELGSARIADTDQFSVYTRLNVAGSTWLLPVPPSIGRITQGTGNTVTLNSGTTGPQPVTAGATYRYGETGHGEPVADIARYSTSVTCTDSRARQTGLPASQPYQEPMLITPVLGALITCTLTNSAITSIGLTKELAVPRLVAGDQFSVQILNQAGTVVGTGTATTTGTGATVTAATGSRLWSPATPGQTATLREIMGGGTSRPTDYDTWIDCENGWIGSPTVLPAGAGQSFTVVPVAGDRISCVLTNDAVPILSTSKVLHTVNGASPVAGQTVSAGDILVYRITVTNSGKGTGSTTLTETVPGSTRYTGGAGLWTGCTPSPSSPAGTACTRGVSVTAGTPQAVDFTVTVGDLTGVTSVSNAVASSDGSCPTCTTTHPATAVLSAVKTLFAINAVPPIPGQLVVPGDSLTWRVTVTNQAAAPGVADLADIVPTGTAFNGPEATWSGCVLTPVRSPAGTSCTTQVTVPAATGGTPGSVTVSFGALALTALPASTTHITNTVTAIGPRGASVCTPASNCTVQAPVLPEWNLTKTVSVVRAGVTTTLAPGALVWPGEVLSYQVAATVGRGTVTGIELIDNLGGLLDDAVVSSGSLVVNGGAPQSVPITGTGGSRRLLATVGSLTAPQTARLTYTATVGAQAWGATVRNRVVGTAAVTPATCNGVAYVVGIDCVLDLITPAYVLVRKLGQGLNGQVDLDGAEFSLLADDSGIPGAVLASPTVTPTGVAGRLGIAGLPPGTYWLRETKAPPGRLLLAREIRFTVQVRDIVPRVVVTLTDAATHPQVTVDVGSPDTIRVVDGAPFALPLTGGAGTERLRWVGIVLLGLCAMLAAIRLRRRRRVVTDPTTA